MIVSDILVRLSLLLSAEGLHKEYYESYAHRSENCEEYHNKPYGLVGKET